MDAAVGLVVIVLSLVGFVVLVRRLGRALDVEGGLRGWPRALLGGIAERLIERDLRRTRAAARALSQKHSQSLQQAQKDTLFHQQTFRLATASTPVTYALRAVQDDDPMVIAIGLTALARRASVPEAEQLTELVVGWLATCPSDLEPFIYRFLLSHAAYPVIGAVLTKLDSSIAQAALASFIAERQASERVTLQTFKGHVPYRHIPLIKDLIAEHGETLGEEFRVAFDDWVETRPDVTSSVTIGGVLDRDSEDFLRSFGRFWERPFDQPPALLVDARADAVARVASALEEGRSVLVVGPTGVGKTTLIRAALERLGERRVFEAGAAQTYAGCVYVGELETKIERIASTLRGTGTIWFFPGFDESISAGQHSRSPRGMIDALQPHLADGTLTIVGEVTEAGLERLSAERPGVAGSFEVIRVRPLGLDDSVRVAQTVLDRASVSATEETLVEAFELTRQFTAEMAPPGNLVRLVSDTVDDALEQGGAELTTSDFLRRLSSSIGMPLVMLDRHTPLDLGQVRAFFEQRILHQPEAVEAVVERIAMVKAGLTDPGRPLGVLFLVGPTGTGKTELAKALAEFMFGSPERMIRLDMSEYVTPDGFERLLAAGANGRSTSLLAAVRSDPFAVVLLDEIEKAAAPVWDLLLQVFEDGRLTDSAGMTVDFRRTVLVMTSNIGSAVAQKPGVGFTSRAPEFDAERMRETVSSSFRPEFVNRIDRIVVFRPFEREHVDALLEKELSAAIGRRGLRTRPWAIELEPGARDFLVGHGFSPQFGARPLKRAIERYLLAPLAEAIVGQGVPAGEQFLLVRANGDRLSVEFVDPDAAPEERTIEPVTESYDLRALVLAPEGSAEAVAFLGAELARIEEASRILGVPELKARALAEVNATGFWSQPNRHRTLGEIEYLDRFDRALATAGKLSRRLEREAVRGAAASDRVEQLAGRLYVLDAALAGVETGAPTDVFLRLRTWHAEETDVEGESSIGMLASMYTQWAERYGMTATPLVSGPRESLFAVSGLGCGAILARESGLHFFSPARTESEPKHRRGVVQVCCVPWVAGPEEQADALLDRARRALDAAQCPTDPVRRYRTGVSPLVRDATRGYRTGRLSDVLSGKFDLF